MLRDTVRGEHGQVTTEELKEIYGYNHPPRAARDVREEGIPLETIRVKGSDGRSIGAYRFDNNSKIDKHKLGGRKVFSKEFKKELCKTYGCHCSICNEEYDERYLQIDHRVPYEVAGEYVGDESQPELFMLICGTCNRKKSWSCENCQNWKSNKDIVSCQTCYWGKPENYQHIALKSIKRLELAWTGSEIGSYDQLLIEAKRRNISIQELIKLKITNKHK